MPDENLSGADDPFDLNRFVEAQKDDFALVLAELKSGRKRSHWMWYIFPQFAGLGYSATAMKYAIKSAAEAAAYLDHPLLGPRLEECCKAALGAEGSAYEIFGYPDDMKLRSCATLFAQVSSPDSVFILVLDRFFRGEYDDKTLHLMSAAPKTE
jgi:uncharacterized protein (DUF1810 family)